MNGNVLSLNNFKSGLWTTMAIASYCLLPSFYTGSLYDGTQTGKLIMFSCILCVALIATPFFIGSLRPRLGAMDLWIFVLFTYLLINFFYLNDQSLTADFYCVILVFGSYFLLRQSLVKEYAAVCLGIVVSGSIIQGIVGNLQIHELMPSQHALFKATGSFFNPGPYSGYLSSIFPAAVGMCIYGKEMRACIPVRARALTTIVPMVAILLILSVIPATTSRASYLAIIFSTIYLAYSKFGKTHIKPYFKRHGSLYFGLIALSACACYFIYVFKIDSGNGRVFIWRNTVTMIAKNPILGLGHGSFAMNYMDIQAEYFRLNVDSAYTELADNVRYAFNDILQLWAEDGIVGVVFLILILLSAIATKSGSALVKCSKAGILSILVFSLFSYPSEILPIKLNLVLYLAIIALYTKKSLLSAGFITIFRKASVRAIALALGVALSVTNACYAFETYSSYKAWGKAFRRYNDEKYSESNEIYQSQAHTLRNDGAFLTQYGKNLVMLGRFEEAVKVLSSAATRRNSTIVQIALGDSYRKTNKFSLAEAAYLNAYYMVPSRVYPLYLLVLLYDERKDTKNALLTAQRIMLKKAKIDSEASLQIKQEMKDYIVAHEQ